MKQNDRGGVKVDHEPVAANTKKYSFNIFCNANFEAMKEVYADALATEIDMEIFNRLPKINIETLIDASASKCNDFNLVYDYVIGPESLVNLLKDRPSMEGVQLFSIPTTLDPDSFMPLAAGGQRSKSNLCLPIFCPYLLFMNGPTMGSVRRIMSRSAWYPKEGIIKC